MALPVAPVSDCARSAITEIAGSRSSCAGARGSSSAVTGSSCALRAARAGLSRTSSGAGGTDSISSRTSRSMAASCSSVARGCCPNSPPNTRETLSTALLPHARQVAVLFSWISSHCTQKTAFCRRRKLSSGRGLNSPIPWLPHLWPNLLFGRTADGRKRENKLLRCGSVSDTAGSSAGMCVCRKLHTPLELVMLSGAKHLLLVLHETLPATSQRVRARHHVYCRDVTCYVSQPLRTRLRAPSQRSVRNLYCASLSGTTESLPCRKSGESPKSLWALISASVVGFSFLPARIVTRGFLGSPLSTDTTVAVPVVRFSSPV